MEKIKVCLTKHALERFRQRIGSCEAPDCRQDSEILRVLNTDLSRGQLHENESELGTHILGFERYRTIFMLRREADGAYLAETYESTMHNIRGHPVSIHYQLPRTKNSTPTDSDISLFKSLGFDRLITISMNTTTGRAAYSVQGRKTWPRIFHEQTLLSPHEWFTKEAVQAADEFKRWLQSILNKPCSLTCRMSEKGMIYLTVEVNQQVTITVATVRRERKSRPFAKAAV